MTDPVNVLAQQALTAQHEKRWEHALELWQSVLAISAQDQQALTQSGNCLVQLGWFDSAKEAFTETTRLWPDHPAGFLGLATAYLKQGRTARALDILFEVKRKFPTNVNAGLLLCQLFMRFKQYDVARDYIADLGNANSEDPRIADIINQLETHGTHVYDQDGLFSVHNHDFMQATEFVDAYSRGLQATQGKDSRWHWRVHVGLWAAKTASHLEGDFIECGVNWGFLSSAIMRYLDWNTLDKSFYLLDTFEGIDPKYVSEAEIDAGILKKNQAKLENQSYTGNFDQVKENFNEWQNTLLIQGSIPETLALVDTPKIAFLHLDMNATIPEQAALNYFWDKLVNGAIVLLDDYAFKGFIEQKKGMDKVAKAKNHQIVSLPTGQGLLIKTH